MPYEIKIFVAGLLVLEFVGLVIAAGKVKVLVRERGMKREEASKLVSEAMNKSEDYASAVKAIRAI